MQELKKFLDDNNFPKRLKNLNKKLKNKKIIIYGAGKFFQTIVKNYDLSSLNIIGICDKSFSSADNGELLFGFPKITRSCLNMYDYDCMLIAAKNYIQCIYDLPSDVIKANATPFVPQFIWFNYIKSATRNYKYLTVLNKTFEIPLSSSEKVLKYLQIQNPQMEARTYSPRNLYTYMADIAARSSAQYVIDNMLKASTFDDRFKLLSYALKNVDTDGKYLEFGVYKGESINFISKQKPKETVYGFDSFEGLPETWTECHKKGHFKVPKLPDVNKNVELIKGWFDKTIPAFQEKHGDFKTAFIHSDSDLYSSTKTMFELLKNNIQPGTVIVFDEYFNYPNWEKGEFLAFQEFITETGFKYEYLGYVYNSTQVAVRILNK